jgi:hypothetical protein
MRTQGHLCGASTMAASASSGHAKPQQVVSKQVCKRQHMPWSKRGAHPRLQTRVKTLNHALRSVFKQWSLDMQVEELAEAA